MCRAILQLYMQDKHAFDIAQVPADTLNQQLYQRMRDVFTTQRNSIRDVKDANNIVLNLMKDNLLKQYKPKPVVRKQVATEAGNVLDRDAVLFGNRPIQETQIKPVPLSLRADENDALMQSFESIVQQRGSASASAPVAPTGTNQKIDPMPSTEFVKKITELERTRDDFFKTAQDTQRPAVADDPAALYRSATAESVVVGKTPQAIQQPLRDYNNFNQDSLIPLRKGVHQSMLVTHYLTINASERQWNLEPLRYRFSASYLNALVNYRNIVQLQFTSLIIPLEIKESRSITNIPKMHYQHGFDFAYPYLMLSVPELDNVYEGMMVKAQTLFIYDTNYCSVNGRGYLILKPMQEETLEYHPTPLGSLPKMTLNIMKPNGMLFNQSKDSHTVQMVVYEAFNSTYLKVVLTRYFDKNEFYQGDTIMIRGYTITPSAGSTVNASFYDKINQFINRPEGHEVLEIGQPNEYGFYKNFSIQAFGVFDNTLGRFVPDTASIASITEFNETCGLLSENYQNGSVLNASLQPIVSMKIKTLAGDPSTILNVQTV